MNILFLCVGNSARSQIAEGLAKDMLPNSFDIRSAGSLPAENVHKHAILVMNDVGIDISKNTTKSIKSIDEKFINNLDYVITLCAQEVCPVVPEATKVPEEEGDMWGVRNSRIVPMLTKAIQEQQTIIDDLKSRIEALEG